VLALFERAIARVDLRQHRGEHPRLGAVDVVPFVPIEDVTMADVVSRTSGAESSKGWLQRWRSPAGSLTSARRRRTPRPARR
jgi:hypothetical protein